MTGGIDEVQFIDFTVLCRILQRDALGLDGDAAFTLEIHRIQHLFRHLAITQATADLDKAIGNGRFTMINMGNDGEIANMAEIGHAVRMMLGRTGAKVPAPKKAQS